MESKQKKYIANDCSLFLTSFQRKLLHKSLENDLCPTYRRRIEIMLLADQGKSQAQICKELGCSQETVRYWITIAQAGKAHQWQDCPLGRPKTVDAEYLNRLVELVSNSPREYGYSFRCWTAQWLSKHLADELGIEVSARHVNRLLKQMGLSTRARQKSAEPVTNQLNSEESSLNIHNLPAFTSPNLQWSLSFLKNL